MNYLYHQVPKDMQGDVLYPLNELKEIYPEIYRKKFAKYENRPHIPRQKIPILNCLWNDVLHLSAIHPMKLKEAFSALGKHYDFVSYQIDPTILSKDNTVIYLHNERKKDDDLNPADFVEYDPELISNYAEIPEETLTYYKERISAGESPLLYHLVPHILYRGSFYVDKASVVS